MNIWDVVLILAIAGAVALAARRVIRNRKQGKCACGCDCGGCDCGCGKGADCQKSGERAR